ncbi:hypothetical protein KA013_00490 [Patescibacteria group bacterium]|nr:hypothetical protein [Patescibacteria group bacterium]
MSIDPQALLDKASKTIDLVIAAPDDLKPIAERGLDPLYGVVRAIDPTEMTPRFDVSKQFVDVDGGNLLK